MIVGSTPSQGTITASNLPANATQDQWAQAFLNTGGWPVTAQNLAAVVAWMQGEGTAAVFNPLATTLPEPGATAFNSSGVQNYTSPSQGVIASVDTVKNTPAYAGINAALMAGTSAQNVANAVVSTGTWTGSVFYSTLNQVLSNYTGNSQSPFNGLANMATQDAGAAVGGVGPLTGNNGLLTSNPITGQPIAALSWTSSLGTALGDLTSSSWWTRIGIGFLGGALVIGGIIIFISTSNTGKKLESTAATAAASGVAA